MNIPNEVLVDVDTLRTHVRDTYPRRRPRPIRRSPFPPGRPLAARLGYDVGAGAEDSGFGQVPVGPPVDTFGDASGEARARSFEVYGCAFLARRA